MVGTLISFLCVVVGLGSVAAIGWRVYQHVRPRHEREPGASKVISMVTLGGSIVAALLAVYVWNSLIYVDADKIGHLKRNVGGSVMDKGQILAGDGQNGPQARILAPGLQLVSWVNLTHDVEYLDLVTVPAGKCALLKARAGADLGDRAYAEAFSSADHDRMVYDAEYFLAHGGTKGPQTSVLTPGDHRLNRYLWEVEEVTATLIPEGFVGVVTSNVHGPVNFGPRFQFPRPEGEDTKPVIAGGGEEGALKVRLVKPGNIGIWNQALPQGTYYLNPKAYKVTQVPVRAQKWEYSGGYTHRWINLELSEDGTVKREPKEERFEVPQDAADTAIFLVVQGHEVAQELRVIVQITEEDAPFVVAAVGDNLKDVEDRIMTPIIREIVRNVVMSGEIRLPEVDEHGEPVVNPETKEPRLIPRRIQVTDLLNNREAVLSEIEAEIVPEGKKAGVTIKEVRLADCSIPPEVTLPLRLKQLAEQMMSSYKEMEMAQKKRIEAEKAKAEADQQQRLVEAEIDVQRSEKLMKAEENKGIGERAKLLAIAEGQRAQKDVLGDERVVELEKFRSLLLFLGENPEVFKALVESQSRLVPHTQITIGGGAQNDGGLAGAAAIFGSILRNADPNPLPQTKVASNAPVADTTASAK